MKKLLLAFAIITAGAAAAHAETAAPELEFKPVGGGKYIYCNNPEAIDAHTIMNGDSPRYVMNNDALGPGKYYIYLSHYNFIGMKTGLGEAVSRDMELDVELAPVGGECKFTLSIIGFETADLYAEYDDNGGVIKREPSWGLLNCCAEAMEKSIIDLDGDRYYPYDGENEHFSVISSETKWLSGYIPNYSVVHYRKPVHIQALLEIESGQMNVNVCAFEAGEILGDRSSMPETAENGIHRYDRTIKGIADTLPQVRAELEYTIGNETEDGAYLPVTMHNQYAPDGAVNYDWITHISALDDPWAKSLADESGMLAFTYKDKSKLTYYGKKAENKTDIWYFDTRHTDTHKFENQPAAKSADYYEPNYPITAKDSVNGYAVNLGNYGVTYTYDLRIRNDGNGARYFVYEPTTESNIIVYTNEDGKESDHAFVKNSNQRDEPDAMSVVELPPGETTEFSVNVVLPVNFNGGIRNAFRIYDSAEKLDFETVYAKHREHKSAKPIKGKYLSEYKDRLPKATYDAFYGTFDDYEVIDCGTFYAARWCIWDTMTSSNAWWLVNHIYILDDDLNIAGSYTHKSLPVGMSYNDGRLYVQTAWNGFYSTVDGLHYREENISELPENEYVYHPKNITLGDYLDMKNSKNPFHTVSIGGTVRYLTNDEYRILYETVKDIPLRSHAGNSDGAEVKPSVSIDDTADRRGINGNIFFEDEYYSVVNDNDLRRLDKMLNYFLYFGQSTALRTPLLKEWAYADMKTAMEYGFIEPRLMTDGGLLDWSSGIRRIDFCRMAKNMLDNIAPLYYQQEDNLKFIDMSSADDAVSMMTYLGIVNGYEDGTFRPDSVITRQEAAVILSRMLAVFDMKERTAVSYKDDGDIQDWARGGLEVCSAYGLMNGTGGGMFMPDWTYTIEQSAVTMLRVFNAITDEGHLMLTNIDAPEIKGNATHFVIYREGYRNGRIELCVYESGEDSEVINDNGVVTVSGGFENVRKYYLSGGEWIWFESGYDKVSNNAQTVFAQGRY